MRFLREALAAVVPALGDLIELDRARPWQPWRWLGCHVAHFGGEHLLWLSVFALAIPRRRRRRS